jgi:hypothetical protein
VWLPRSRACAEPGYKDELNQADRWYDPACRGCCGGTKGPMRIVPEALVLCRMVVPPLARGGGTISSMEYLVSQLFAAGVNWVVSKFVGS